MTDTQEQTPPAGEKATMGMVSNSMADAAAAQAAADAAAAQERADMEAVGRSFMERLADLVASEPDWKGWAPADDPTELVGDMLEKINELKAQLAEVLAPPPAPELIPGRDTPLAWDELAPHSIAGTLDIVAWIVEGADHSLIMTTEPYSANSMENWGVFSRASEGKHDEIIRYAIERRPSPEVLFNKMRELGLIAGEFYDLAPYQRAGLELGGRVIVAAAEAIDIVNTVIVAKNPPPAPAISTVAVDPEDTILERVDGLDDIDRERAAIEGASAQAAADREKKASKGKGKTKKARSIDAGGDE